MAIFAASESGAPHAAAICAAAAVSRSLSLASVLAWDQAIARLTVASCDDRIRANALALGFDVALE